MISALMTGGRVIGSRQQSADPVEEAALATFHVVAESCAVRQSPEASGRVVGQVERGGSLSVDTSASMRSGGAGSGRGAARVQEQTRGLSWLRVAEPVRGWCAASECCWGEYSALGSLWRFVVVCRDGAFVREGLELASPHLYTLARHAVFEVRERRVNEQGLARLRTDDGWISEDLNPLSGQRGPIASLLPLRRQLSYRVVLEDGAVVRDTVELSSPVVQVVPRGELVCVDEKQFSDHPAQHCVPRLHLTHPVRGWISQRLNREPPDDLPVVQLVGLASDDVRPKPLAAARLARANSADSDSGAAKNPRQRITDAINGETLCVVCLSAARNATFVHGETGHIACCLSCARALKARGDSCPVCRMSIERVIQHFWA